MLRKDTTTKALDPIENDEGALGECSVLLQQASDIASGLSEGQNLTSLIGEARMELGRLIAFNPTKAARPAERKFLTRLEEMAEDVGYSGSDIQGMIDAVYAAVPGDSEALDVIESVCAEYGYTPPWEKAARPTGQKVDTSLAERLERQAAAAERRLAELERETAPAA